MIIRLIQKLLQEGFFSSAWVMAKTKLSDREISNGPDWLRALANADENNILNAAEISRDMIDAEDDY